MKTNDFNSLMLHAWSAFFTELGENGVDVVLLEQCMDGHGLITPITAFVHQFIEDQE